MRRILALFAILCMMSLARAEDMFAYIQRTRELTREGKYQEALARHQWMHQQPFENPGIRVASLLEWKELGERYEPAKLALGEFRDAGAKTLAEGGGDVELFQAVSFINEQLGETERTLKLFDSIDQQSTKRAREYWLLAKNSVVEAKRYDLVKKYLGDPLVAFELMRHVYAVGKRYDETQGTLDSEVRKRIDEAFVKELLQLIDMTLAIGDRESAEKIRDKALMVIDDNRLRKAIPVEVENAR